MILPFRLRCFWGMNKSFPFRPTGVNREKSAELIQVKFEKKFGTSPVFVASTLMENGGVPVNASPASLLSEAIQVISCGYEDRTEWGKEVSFSSRALFC